MSQLIPLVIFLLACVGVYLGSIGSAFSVLMRLSLRLVAERSDRPDALARYLQTAAEDDLADSGHSEPVVWLVRRCELRIRSLPTMGERLKIATFCSGTGPRWAERTTTLSAAGGEPLVQATAVWAAVSAADGRPVPLSVAFLTAYGGSAGGRVVSARLSHPRPVAAVHDGNGVGITSRPAAIFI